MAAVLIVETKVSIRNRGLRGRKGVGADHMGCRGEGRCKATWEREFKLSWREVGPPNHNDDIVDSDQ